MLRVFRAGIFSAFCAASLSLAHAQSYWTGTNISFYNPGDGATDILTANVILARGTVSGGLYNAANETNATVGISPAGTEWGFGTLAAYMSNHTNVTFTSCELEQGFRPPSFVGTNFVVHLITNNIYLQLTLTSWGTMGGGPTIDSYTRSTPSAAGPPPTISITNPANGAVFAAPANEKIAANATVSSGAVTNVQFFTNNVSVGKVTTPPFTLTPTLGAGNYALTAVATAAGVSATSGVVNISVVTPIAVTLTNAKTSSKTNFQFTYVANVGLNYIIQRSGSLAPPNWVPLATNVAAGNPTNFTDTHATSNPAFYRVGRLPNP